MKPLGKRRGDDRHGVDLLGVAAAGEVVDRRVQTEQDRAVGVEGAEALGDLVADVAGVDVGEDKGIGVAADRVGDVLGFGDSRRDRRVELELAADRGVGHEGLGLLAGIAHLVDVLALAGAEGGVAQESDLRVNAEDLGAGNGLLADLDELVLVGLDVDGAVGHGEHFVLAGSCGTDHDEAGRDDLVAWLGLDELQRGTDRVGRGVGSAAEQAVGLAHLDEHGAEVVALLERGAALVGGHLALAQLHQGGDHLLHVGEGLGINDLSAPDVEADLLGHLPALLGVADQDRGQEGTGPQAGRGLQHAGLMISAPRRLKSMSSAAAAISSGLPTITGFKKLPDSRRALASRMRGSVPSVKTIVLGLFFSVLISCAFLLFPFDI